MLYSISIELYMFRSRPSVNDEDKRSSLAR